MNGLVGLLILGVLVMMYFLPSIIAFNRQLSNRWSVLIINFFFGWTFIGWVSCLAMSASGAKASAAG